MARSRVELFEAIRRDRRWDESLSVRGLADRYGVHRRTVRQALAAAVPPERKAPVRVVPRLDPARPLIDAMLRGDLEAPRKQRHTARRVHARLVDEHGLGEITYSTVRDYVRVRRPQIWAEAGRSAEQVFVPQTHEPGAEAEVDFADLWVVLDGVKTKTFLFTLRLSYSGKAVHRAFATQSQEAFLEGHVAALEALGGVPVVHIRYDNLKAAVSRVLFGRTRVENSRWVAFRSHYGFDAFYCQPGREGAHEKGGVEGEGGRFRRTHLVPMPSIASIAELNERLAAYDAADDARRVGHRTQPVGHDFAFEARLLRPLPAEAFEAGITLTPRVDRHARITVRQCQYSVPAADRPAGAGPAARHRGAGLGRAPPGRRPRKGHRARLAGPGARPLPGGAGPQARGAAGRHRSRAGPRGRVLVEVLLLHRHLPAAAVVAGLRAALAVGATSPEVVAVEARRAAASAMDASAAADVAGGPVLTLPDRPLAPTVLTPESRSLPSVQAYDELLSRRTPDASAPAAGESIRKTSISQGEAVS